MMLTASPPRAVSLYFTDMGAPCSTMPLSCGFDGNLPDPIRHKGLIGYFRPVAAFQPGVHGGETAPTRTGHEVSVVVEGDLRGRNARAASTG